MSALYRNRNLFSRDLTAVVDAYLLHFDPPFKHARHYSGICEPGAVEERVKNHDAVLVREAKKAGSTVTLARVWRDVPRRFELSLKSKSLKFRCPVCKGLNNENSRIPSLEKYASSLRSEE